MKTPQASPYAVHESATIEQSLASMEPEQQAQALQALNADAIAHQAQGMPDFMGMRPELVEFARKEMRRQIELRRVRTPAGLAGLFPGLGTRKR